jgi:predicted metalloprotease with PDZ domain
MRGLYESTYKQHRGFTTADWWRAVEEAAGGRPFAEFASRYIDGRDPFPWAAVAPLAGLRYVADTVSEPRIGVSTVGQEGGQTVTAVVPGSAAAEAGVAPGDQLVRLGSIDVDANFGQAFRITYRARIGETVPLVVRRDGRDVTLRLVVRGGIRVEEHLEFDRRAPLKAVRIRHGILTGGAER